MAVNLKKGKFSPVFSLSSKSLQQREELLPVPAFRSTLLSQQLIAVTTSIKQKLASKSGYPAFQGTKSIWQWVRGVLHPMLERKRAYEREHKCVRASVHMCKCISKSQKMYACVAYMCAVYVSCIHITCTCQVSVCIWPWAACVPVVH